MTKALLINPEDQTITPIDIDLDPLRSPAAIRQSLSCQYPVETPLANGDALLFDQKGFQNTENLAFNLFGKGAFFGKVLIIGEWRQDYRTDPDDLIRGVTFYGKGGSCLLREHNKSVCKTSAFAFFQH